MQAKIEALRMSDFTVNRLDIAYLESHDIQLKPLTDMHRSPEPETLQIDFAYDGQVHLGEVGITMEIKSNYGDARLTPGFSYNLEVGAFFWLDGKRPQRQSMERRLLGLLQASVFHLLSMARGYLNSVTAAFPQGPCLIPFVDLNPFIDSKVREMFDASPGMTILRGGADDDTPSTALA